MLLYIYFATLSTVPWPYLSVWPARTLRRLPDKATVHREPYTSTVA
jgi:hypothetical protein